MSLAILAGEVLLDTCNRRGAGVGGSNGGSGVESLSSTASSSISSYSTVVMTGVCVVVGVEVGGRGDRVDVVVDGFGGGGE